MSLIARKPTQELIDLVGALGGTWSGASALCRCPAHNDRTPSLSLRQGDHGFLVYCYAGCDSGQVLRALRQIVPNRSHTSPAWQDAPTRSSNIARIWNEGLEIKGSLAESYLRSRKLASNHPDLRFHPRCPQGPSPLTQFKPALLVAVREGWKLTAIQRIFLDPITGAYTQKLMIGSPGQGAWRGAVRDGCREWQGWSTGTLANAGGLASLMLDSAGFTALATYRGYPWTIERYLDLAQAYPFRLFAAPDYCCEAQVAADRDEVLDRIARTTGAFNETHRRASERGIADRLMPVLQGRTPDDYERSTDQLSHVITPGTTIGVGSMCRRAVAGAEGLIAVLDRLDRILPGGVMLHGFGVKGTMLSHVGHLAHRIISVDSQAYGVAARRDALIRKVPKTDRLVARHLRPSCRSWACAATKAAAARLRRFPSSRQRCRNPDPPHA